MSLTMFNGEEHVIIASCWECLFFRRRVNKYPSLLLTAHAKRRKAAASSAASPNVSLAERKWRNHLKISTETERGTGNDVTGTWKGQKLFKWNNLHYCLFQKWFINSSFESKAGCPSWKLINHIHFEYSF